MKTMNAAIHFVLDGFPRTGSTTLTQVLNLHPDIRCAMEPFHPKRFGGTYHRIAMDDGIVAAMQTLKNNFNGLKHVWEPLTGWPFSAVRGLNDEIIKNTSFIVTLRRRNLLKQFVSGYACRQLQFWVGTRSDFYERLNSVTLPPIRIAQAEAEIAAMRSAIINRDLLLQTLPAGQLILHYEDLFENDADVEAQVRLCNQLFTFLGFSTLNTEVFRRECKLLFNPDIHKWSTEEIYARIPGCAALERTLGSDETGWLFS